MYLKDKAFRIVQKLRNLSLLIKKAGVSIHGLDKENKCIRISPKKSEAGTEQSQQLH